MGKAENEGLGAVGGWVLEVHGPCGRVQRMVCEAEFLLPEVDGRGLVP